MRKQEIFSCFIVKKSFKKINIRVSKSLFTTVNYFGWREQLNPPNVDNIIRKSDYLIIRIRLETYSNVLFLKTHFPPSSLSAIIRNPHGSFHELY